ncbi:hypothetical protein BU24DRAFT_436872 [Aaosphaeria arxii CBS 175.79]|uniref:Ferric oxidoreductase domain-containing protein n=1 Tax=Aaosphaeria arxii CBS 175.79 TaxID=1450172 RepID=A0A6A5XAR2_9PLEO|nr:uncharacterized protein BU24DRAFT_436872 [Aaosphaeria arxii CBS 175.79]KAF2009999.1 hypothetical protein BU24DRAFT_436872 [Aaosphaeria arxii CBS 175.79]
MKSFFYSFLILAVTWPFAASTALCPSACESALSYVVFSGNATKQQCTNQLHIVSYYSCLRQYCPGEAVEAYTALKKTCKSTAAIPTIANVTVDVDGLAKITAKDLYKKAPVKQPVTLEESLYLLSVRTITSAAAQDEINVRYGHAMYGFWALTILVSSLMKLWEFLTTKYPRVAQKGWVNKASTKLRQHVTIPALAGKRTAENIGWCTVPPRLQSLVIIAFIALNLALCVSGYDVFPGNLKRPSIPNQVSRLIGRRTGVLIMANLPLMWTFAMRNNILSWISGWTFATFSSFHRWIARVVMAELVAHAVAYSLSDYYSGGLKKYYAQWPQEYWWWGVVSIIAGSFATASAIYPIRQRFYDAFLLGHIVLAMLFLVGTWFHIKKQDNEFDMYFWPCVAVWAFDRALRLGRVLVLNCRRHILLRIRPPWP